MPLYEYQCESCGHRFEAIQKFSDAPLEICPKCGGPVRKLIAAPAFQFKGSGWYITDYAKKDSSPAGSSEGPKDAAAAKTGASSGGDASSSEKAGEKPAPAGGTAPAKP